MKISKNPGKEITRLERGEERIYSSYTFTPALLKLIKDRKSPEPVSLLPFLTSYTIPSISGK